MNLPTIKILEDGKAEVTLPEPRFTCESLDKAQDALEAIGCVEWKVREPMSTVLKRLTA